MKSVSITGPRQCTFVERELPVLRDNYCLVKVLAAPMCTEFHGYREGHVNSCLGHEASGVIVAIGPNAKLSIGERVVVMPQNSCGACELCTSGEHIYCATPREVTETEASYRATYAEYCIQQDWLLLPVPTDITMEFASMACCGLGPTFNALRAMQSGLNDTVLVSGLGPVGLGAVINARARGSRVLGFESNPWRASLARELGAEAVVDPSCDNAVASILALTNGVGADMSIESSSAEGAPGRLVEATRSLGQITTVGWGGPVFARDLTRKGLAFRGAWHWNHIRDADAMFETIRSSRGLLNQFITHTFPLTQVQDAWEVQLTGKCGKIVLLPTGSGAQYQ